MPSSSSLSFLAAKLCKAARPQPSAHSALRCLSSKAKAKGKGKDKEETAPPPPSASSDKKSNKKPHWSQLVFYKVNPRLSDVLQSSELTRPEAIDRIWDYIKSNNLQNNEEIVCDEALKKAFGQAKVQRTEVLKLLDHNLTRLRP